jgi:cyclophilin family peptidyl-prolyl cis-trans isomerase
MRKVYSLILVIILLFVLTGCSSDTANNTTNTNVKSAKKNTTNTTNTSSSTSSIDYKSAAEKQMSMPEDGETIAIFHVKNFGDIKVKFFEDVAPKAVENFITHAKDGYYNGVTFHRVINEFMIQGGDPTGTGTGGESIWGENFQAEVSYEYVPYRGSLCMASSSLGLGSQFFITQANYSATTAKSLTSYGYPKALIEQYKTYGGYMSLYMNYTVFGQVFEGIEVVDKIAQVETHTTDNGQENKPVEDVVIESIEVTTYQAN